MQNASENGDRKVTMFLILMLYTLNSSLIMIKNVSYKINNKDISNSNLYLILFACNKLAEIVDKLPNDEFKNFFIKIMKENLSKMTCYVIDNNSQINCNDFYENFLKRKKVNEELLSKIELKTGGFGGLMFGIAITALALLQTTTSVSGALFNSDNFVMQNRAIHGMSLSPEFREALQEKSITKTQLNTTTDSLQSIYPYEPLTEDQEDVLARLDANIHGVCAVNSFIAELCTGGCPSKEEWDRLSPKMLQKIRNNYVDKFMLQALHGFYSKSLTLDQTIEPGVFPPYSYGTDYVKVPDGFDMEWFRTYFSEGAKKHFSKEKSSSDIAIAIVSTPQHVLNVMYNINNQKLCVHDENNKTRWSWYEEKFVLPLDSQEYICEEGFFEEYQIKELNKLGSPVVETTDNIFKLYIESWNGELTKISEMQTQESIFFLDKSKNTGNIDQYIEILKDIRKSMIEGERDGIEYLKTHQKMFNISDKTFEIMREAVNAHEEAYNLEIPFNLETSDDKIKSLKNELNDEQSKSKGGNKKNFTSKIHRKIKKHISKKNKTSKKRKSKTKRNK